MAYTQYTCIACGLVMVPGTPESLEPCTDDRPQGHIWATEEIDE